MERELQRLDDKGIIYKVSGSDWAAPVALVPKKDGSLRVCGDYKTTVNPCADVDQYPLPTMEDFFATLAGGQVFSKIDLSHAYQQVQLNEDSLKYLTINTHKGLYCYKRLSLGVSSAPAILQRTMDQLLQGVKFTVCRLDDILISGGSPEEHFAILEDISFTRVKFMCVYTHVKINSTSSPGRFSLALEVGREKVLASAGQSVILIG